MREQLRDKIEKLADRATGQTLNQVTSDKSKSLGDTLKTTATICRTELLDELLSERFIKPVEEAVGTSIIDRKLLNFEVRKLARPLIVEPPEPNLIIQPRAWALSACLGALLGLFMFTPAVRLLLGQEFKQTGLLIGGPLGALLGVLFVGFVGRHMMLLRALQAVLGIGTGVELVSLFFGQANPFIIVWQKLANNFSGGGALNGVKRIVLYLIGIFIVQCVVPVSKVQHTQLEKSVRSAILAWLSHHTDLMILLAIGITTGSQDNTTLLQSSGMPGELIRALEKLTGIEEPGQRASMAKEVIQEFKNAGYEIHVLEEQEFSETMLEQYDVVGLIEPGDQVRILESSVIRDGLVVLKGKLTRERG